MLGLSVRPLDMAAHQESTSDCYLPPYDAKQCSIWLTWRMMMLAERELLVRVQLSQDRMLYEKAERLDVS